ncbi:hypothetical protein [Sphingomonas oryzagri]
MIEDLAIMPSAIDDFRTRQSMAEERITVEAARTLADLLSHMRFLLANGGSPLSNREQAILDLLEIGQDLPLAALERRRVLHGRCIGYSVAECCERTRKELASASHLAVYDPPPIPAHDTVDVARPAESFGGRVLKTLGALLLIVAIGCALVFVGADLFSGPYPRKREVGFSGTRVQEQDLIPERKIDEHGLRELEPEDVQEPSR